MAWAMPMASRTKVDAAADIIIGRRVEPEHVKILEAFDTISNWRSCHSWPLLAIRLGLAERARAVNPKALIAQRLKRLPAVIGKLLRFKQMKLSQMQDIGGCRAILPKVSQVERLDRAFSKAAGRRQKHQPECIERYDYIKHPKDDGYRGIHLVYKYHTRLEKYSKYDGLRIEMQLRSQIQHEWATAVETVDLFTKQALKSSIGKREWKRFFFLVATLFAVTERRRTPADAPKNMATLKAELRELVTQLNVDTAFSAWGLVLTEFLSKRISGARTFLLTLNLEEKKLALRQYTVAMQKQATDDYLAIEKEILEKKTPVHAVLVSVASLKGLKQAYPSFYADTTSFLHRLRAGIGSTASSK